MRICPFCDIKFGNCPHIYACKKRTTNDKKEIKFLYIQKNFPAISSKDVLYEEYFQKLQSLVDIKNAYGIDFKSTIFLLSYFGFEKRNISMSAKSISSKKYKATCLSKYGVDNVSKHSKFKNSKKETFLKNYGVDNIFKDKSFQEWILENNFAWTVPTEEENILRIKKQTKSIKKFWKNLTDEQKDRIFGNRFPNGMSNLETKISECLNNLSISYTSQFKVGSKLFDFKLSNTNILIEVNGDFWHANPSIYEHNQMINYPGGKIKASDLWKKDETKLKMANKKGYRVIYIWENEMSKLNLDQLSKLLINKIYLGI